MARLRTVRLYPSVDARSVTIAWDDPAFARHFKRPGIRIDYHGTFDSSEPVVASLAAGLLAPLVAASKERDSEVRLLIEGDADPQALQGWQAYHALHDVHIEATGSASRCIPGVPGRKTRRSTTALLYGGGKDSLAALGLFHELRSGGDIGLFRLHWRPPSPVRQREAFERFCLPRLQAALPLAYHSCSIDLHSNCRDPSLPRHTHMALYFASFLPVLAAARYDELNFSYDCLDYYRVRQTVAYRRGHPDVFELLNSIFRRHAIGTRVRNISFGLTPGAHYSILAACYPGLVETIYSCESVHRRWCFECDKCFSFALFCVMHDIRAEHFDLARYFATSRYFAALCAEATAVASRHRGAPHLLPAVAKLSHPTGFLGVRNRLARLRSRLPAITDLGAGTIRQLGTLVDLLAITSHSELNGAWEHAIRYEAPAGDAEALIRILERGGIDIVKDPVIRSFIKGRAVEYSYGRPDAGLPPPADAAARPIAA